MLSMALAVPACKTAQETEESPVQVEALVDQAEQLRVEGHDDEALALLALAIERNPTLATAHLKMGEIYQGQGKIEAAARSFSNAAEHDPYNFDAQYGYGLMLHLLERFAEAVRVYLKALALRPDDFEANRNIANAYMSLNEPGQAITFAQKAVALDPANGEAHATLGTVFSALKQYDAAVKEYESAAELMELTPRLLLDLAENLGKLNRYQEMGNTLATLIKLNPSAAAHERLGYAYFKQRRYAEAMQQFRASLDLDRAHYPAMNGLGVCLLNQYILSEKNDKDAQREAIELLRHSLRINSSQPRVLELVSRFGQDV